MNAPQLFEIGTNDGNDGPENVAVECKKNIKAASNGQSGEENVLWSSDDLDNLPRGCLGVENRRYPYPLPRSNMIQCNRPTLRGNIRFRRPSCSEDRFIIPAVKETIRVLLNTTSSERNV